MRLIKWINSLSNKMTSNAGKLSVIGIPYLVLILLFTIPFLVVLKTSVSELDGIHYLDLTSYVDGVIDIKIKLSNYLFLTSDPLYIETYWSSIKFAGMNTIICLFIGYPFAYYMARSPAHLRPALLMLVSLPFWTSFLLRVYAWRGLLDDQGVFNNILMWMHVISEPIHMMHTAFSLTIGMVYTYLPFMILPLYATLVKMDLRLIEAAQDLGATPWKTFWLITVPLSKNGIVAGCMLVFIPSLGEYVIPELLGGPSNLMIGRVLWDEYFNNNDLAMASTVAVTMIALILIPLVIFNKYQSSNSGKGA